MIRDLINKFEKSDFKPKFTKIDKLDNSIKSLNLCIRDYIVSKNISVENIPNVLDEIIKSTNKKAWQTDNICRSQGDNIQYIINNLDETIKEAVFIIIYQLEKECHILTIFSK
jgi:hypothetical protein